MNEERQTQEIVVLIMAGGKSQRMHYPKAFLKLGSQSLVQHIIETYAPFVSETYVVLNNELFEPRWDHCISKLCKMAALVINKHPDKGRFFSIQLGLKEIGEADYCFIQNVDNPPTAGTISALMDEMHGGYSIPHFDGRNGHPVLLGKEVINAIRRSENTDHHFREFLNAFPGRNVAVDDESILLNLNTPSDYRAFITSKFPFISDDGTL